MVGWRCLRCKLFENSHSKKYCCGAPGRDTSPGGFSRRPITPLSRRRRERCYLTWLLSHSRLHWNQQPAFALPVVGGFADAERRPRLAVTRRCPRPPTKLATGGLYFRKPSIIEV